MRTMAILIGLGTLIGMWAVLRALRVLGRVSGSGLALQVILTAFVVSTAGCVVQTAENAGDAEAAESSVTDVSEPVAPPPPPDAPVRSSVTPLTDYCYMPWGANSGIECETIWHCSLSDGTQWQIMPDGSSLHYAFQNNSDFVVRLCLIGADGRIVYDIKDWGKE